MAFWATGKVLTDSRCARAGADNECKVKSHLALAQMKEKGRSVGTNDGAVIEEVVVVE